MSQTPSAKPATAQSAVALPEHLSALADGELDGIPTAAWLVEDAIRCERWADYHLIGAVMREGAACDAPANMAFVNAVMGRLERSPAWDEAVAARPVPAANDSVFRWKALASVATVAAVLSVGWQWGADTGPTLASVEPAAPAAPVLVQTAAGQMLRDPQLEELMAAHRQLGGVSALQMPAGFVRNATFEVPAR